jgi:dihydrofolate synthase/folylpolyglutamate synthase
MQFGNTELDSTSVIEHLKGGDWNSRLGLERMRELLKRLGNPHDKLRYVHVAGTNGKGSICAMSAQVLTAAGYRTGLYISPYINRFHEHIQIDGVPISDRALAEMARRVQEEADLMADPPTEFERITAIAFLYFLESRCDIVVLEVGLGGRLDATNVISQPEAAVIAPISLDHMKELGDTVEKIAAEKAGIIKQGCRVVSSPQLPGVARVLQDVCALRDASIEFLDHRSVTITGNSLDGIRFTYKHMEDIELHLLGAFQPQNASAVIMVMEQLRSKGWNISESALREGLRKTRWPARFEIVNKNPWVIVDGGHNRQCMESLADNLNTYFPDKKITFVIGFMADKDYRAMLRSILPFAGRIFTVTPDNPRSMPAEELAEYVRSEGMQDVIACASVEAGIKDAMRSETGEGVICATGTFYMAGTIRNMFVSI